jgi:hypothetical protein
MKMVRSSKHIKSRPWKFNNHVIEPTFSSLLHNNIRGFVRCDRRPLGVEVQ